MTALLALPSIDMSSICSPASRNGIEVAAVGTDGANEVHPAIAPTNTIQRSAVHESPHSENWRVEAVCDPAERFRPRPERTATRNAGPTIRGHGSRSPPATRHPATMQRPTQRGRLSDHETGSPSGKVTTLTCVLVVKSRPSISSEMKASDLPSGDHLGDQLSPSPSVIWRVWPDWTSTKNNCRKVSPVNPRSS